MRRHSSIHHHPAMSAAAQVLSLLPMVSSFLVQSDLESVCRSITDKTSQYVERLVVQWQSNSAHSSTFRLSPTTTVTPTVAKSSKMTGVGLHWDNIKITGPSVTCVCCDALETAAKDYRTTVQLMYRRWLLAVQPLHCQWRRDGLSSTVVTTKLQELHAQTMPSDGFFNETMASACDEELMLFICAYTDMPFIQSGDHDDGQTPSTRSSVDSATRLLCRQVLCPFAAFANQNLHSVQRVCAYDEESGGCQDVVAGVSMTGDVIGFTCTVQTRR